MLKHLLFKLLHEDAFHYVSGARPSEATRLSPVEVASGK